MVCMPVVRLHGVTLDQSFRLLYRLLPCMSARHYDALCARYPCHVVLLCFFFKQKTAYVMRISDWSSDVCSSDLTNSAGSLRQDMPPGSVMQITDHINYSGINPLIGEGGDGRFVGMTNAYDAELATGMRNAAIRCGIPLFTGVYMWFSGPSFETPAEIRMARTLGADAVGMSTVPEVILARYFGLRVVAASVITNYGAGMTGAELSHEETKDMAPVGGQRLAAILQEMLSEKA